MAGTTNNPLGPQPDFLRMSQIQHEFANEMTKFSNTPRFDPNNAILQTLQGLDEKFDMLNGKIDTAVQQLNGKIDTAVQQLNGKIDAAVQQFNRRFDEFGERLDKLDKRQQISDHNHVARIHNSLLQTASEDLSAFVHPITNTPIQGFPVKPRDIGNMSKETLNSLLNNLGLATVDESKPLKQQRLRSHIGLRADPV